jgi:hypothetical protein
MLLDTYEAEERFWLITCYGPTGTPGLSAFRGDFVVLEGKLNETAGKRNPPRAVLKQAVLLADAEKLQFVAGNFASVEEIPSFVDRFKDDLAPTCVPVLYVDNIPDASTIQIGANRYVLLPFRDGTVWNALMDELFVDKADLRGMEAEDKAAVLYGASKGHVYKYPERTLEAVLATKTSARRETWGAV